jgi:tetratricopeptide (TPR) repeat protein
MRPLARGWRGAERFGLLLFSREEGGSGGGLGDQIRAHLAAGELLVPVSRNEAYVLLPGTTAQKALQRGRALQKKLAQGSVEVPTSLGISSWPCLTFSRGEAPVNCRRALLHGRFSGPGAVTVFDHLSLNVSGDYFFDEGDYRRAVRDYRAGLLLNPGDVNLMNSLGVALAELNRQQQAITVFDRVLAVSPRNFMALANKGFAQRMLGHHDAALATLEQAARHSGFRKSEAFADISLQLGRLYCAAGRYREALPILERLEASGKDLSGFHLDRLLGESYAGVGRNQQAIRALQHAVRNNGHDAQSLSILGELYAKQEQGDDIALSLCQRAVALDDSQARHWYRLAWVRAKMGADEAARNAVGEALRRSRRDPEVLVLAAQIYRRLGLGGKARAIDRRLQLAAGHRKARSGIGPLRSEHQQE